MAIDTKTGDYFSEEDDLTPPSYEAKPDERRDIAKLNEFYTTRYNDRRIHEGAWFLCAAYFRGNQAAVWNDADHRLLMPPGPRRRREIINRFQRKVLSRRARFIRNRSKPEVRPATTDIDDKMNARYTTKALEYQNRRLMLEQRYDEALMWANLCAHGFLWLHWDPLVIVRGYEPDPMTGQKELVESRLGDVSVEVGSPFEILVGDPSLPFIGDQPAIMRMKIRDLDWIRQMYPEKGKYVRADAYDDESQRQARYIAGLASGGWSTAVTGTFTRSYARAQVGERNLTKQALVKEYFEKPSAKYPNGCYIVMACNIILAKTEELPEGFFDMNNPYPCVDFPDILHPGQYWGSTIAEQLIGPQQSYNRIRTAIDRNLRRGVYPKILVDRRHKIVPGAWTDEEQEIVEVTNQIGIPEPKPWTPPSVAADAWRTVDILREEFDVVSGIYSESEGQVGKASSGFQTNLLQEATDMVHMPDILIHERAKEDLYRKIRRMMKRRYDAKRLITISGRNTEPEVFEFSQSNIDEYADLIIESGSMLPELKGARIQALLEMWGQDALGPRNDKESLRKLHKLLEFGDREELYDWARADEERARLENEALQNGEVIAPALFCDDHDIHYRIHADELKKAQSRNEPYNTTLTRVQHMLTHARYINPNSAATIASEYGLAPPPPPGQPASPEPIPAPPQMPGMPPPGAPVPPQAPPAVPPPGQPPPFPGAPPAPATPVPMQPPAPPLG